MSFKRHLFLLVLVGFLLDVRVATACSCRPTPTVLEAYERAEVVVIARVVSVEKSEHGEGYGGINSTKMVVEKVFKGDLKAGDEMAFAQGAGTDCVWGFYQNSVGQRFLLYLGPRQNNKWYAMSCGRSASLPDAAGVTDDLLYLSKIKEVQGRTRLSGTIQFIRGSEVNPAGRTIRVIGSDKTYEVKTNESGVYEIYDLPAGKYLVEPEVPAGWKLSDIWLRYSQFLRDDPGGSPKRIPIVLEDKKHVSLDIVYELDNAIRGRLFDPNGNPMKDVCIDAVPAQGKQAEAMDCTKEGGSFALTRLPRGSYVLVINRDGKISSSEPFKTFYYPNVFEREKAVAVAIREGEALEDVNIYAPKVEDTITVEGTFLYSDGKPVAHEFVQFQAGKTNDDVEGEAHASTDANGRFSIKLLKGLKGKLHGEMYSYVGEFENCPQLDSILKKTGQTVQTPVLEVPAETDLSDVELKYPFPGCKKAQ